ncbi:hypothetical protein M8C21_002032 [Ambrosia artemisiifolia]|uniref:Uncharacterized protein n=1 Tax=Ambrosia artemisiifolia TaxID=4212 RepID=A0AAD5CTW6_AMBAR|nr:hypothetical protein M8C21_002032 [Ambrosia artemisiifolia]
MSKRGKRGVASCSKKMREDELHIEFDENMLPTGVNRAKFSSWLGLTLRKRFPYHIDTCKFEKQMWEDLWLDVKDHWKILDDEPKQVLIKKAKKNCTTWRSKLVREFVNKNELPFAKYRYLDQSKWKEFVALKTSDEFLKKSEKAKLSALKNKDPPRTGRTGYNGLKEKFAKAWTQLLSSYPYLREIQSARTRRWISSRARLNKQTGLYEVEHIRETINDLIRFEREMKADGTYCEGRVDPLTRCFGPEHGGRSRTVSCIIGSTQVHKGSNKGGRKRKKNGVPTTQIRSDERVNVNMEKQRVDASPDFHSSSCESGGSYIDDYPDIRTPEQELGDRNTTHVHDVSSGFTTRSKEAQITDVDASRGERFQSSAGSKGNTQVIVSDDIHQESPHDDHEIIVTQTHESEDGTSHQRKKRAPQDHDSEDGTGHQKKQRTTPTKSLIKRPTGLVEASSSLSPPDHHGNSVSQASARTTSTNYEHDWPFIKRSPMWAIIELHSQKPHFAPLKEMNEDCREGLAIAHIVTFGNLVQRISDFKPNDPVDKFNNSLETLSDLETHGFDVGPIRGRLNQLLSLKTKMCQQEDTRKEVEKDLEKCDHEKSRVDKEMDRLKEKMRMLKSKSEQIATMQKAKEKELERLETKDLELDFEKLAATPL